MLKIQFQSKYLKFCNSSIEIMTNWIIFTYISIITLAIFVQGSRINDEFFDEVRQLLEQKQQQQYQNQRHPQGEFIKHDIEEDNGQLEQYRYQNVDSPPKPKEIKGWPSVPLKNIGQITAVSVNPDGNPVIFHRADRVWTAETFNDTDYYQFMPDGPIQGNTIITLDARDGSVIEERGRGLFYMPHGMTIDRLGGNIWLTDVALHQVFKFKPGHDYPSITLGRRFEPGVSRYHLCKPTSVAVASTGEIFVADGYCNNRVMKFNALGRLIRIIPKPPEFLSLQVPHGLTLLEHLDLLCIADRENMRVVCPKAGLKSTRDEGEPAVTIQEPDLGRVFAVAAYGDLVYAVNGPTSQMIPIRGFTIHPKAETIIDHWGKFENPHSISFCPNGSAMYVTEIGPNKIWKFELA
uniref:peptidylamidoglycolate lyase n=1 Tax=Culicoides sonorensis TaxID=179676 RepID=A0A336LKU6_CULSO